MVASYNTEKYLRCIIDNGCIACSSRREQYRNPELSELPCKHGTVQDFLAAVVRKVIIFIDLKKELPCIQN